MKQLRSFVKNLFILDEHRSQLIPLQLMKEGRADHTLLFFKNCIYAIGGMNYAPQSFQGNLCTLNSIERYSIENDEWILLPNHPNSRYAFSACTFNDKQLFLFGGKRLKAAALDDGPKPFDFVKDVDVFDIEKNQWKTINFVTEKEKLKIINPGSLQVSGKIILIFGGIIEHDEERD